MSLSLRAVTAGEPRRWERSRHFLATHPEWWAWLLCALIWILLFINAAAVVNSRAPVGRMMFCGPQGAGSMELVNITAQGSTGASLPAVILNGFPAWMIMIVAMMFPLLREPLRHVAFSIRKKDRSGGVLLFLCGYLVAWMIAGVPFLLLPFYLKAIGLSPFFTGGIGGSGFLLAAVLAWLPGRPVRMIRCSWTMPIRIRGWQLHRDCFSYGLRMGVACLGICWAPMFALALAGHGLWLMYAVTVIIISERYLLPHTSKLPGSAWLAMSLLLFGMAIGS